MKLKTYRAPSLHAALRLARIELGADAMLVEAREAGPDEGGAKFQVTFALGAGEAPEAAPPEPPVARPAAARIEKPHWRKFLRQAEAAPQGAEPAPPAAEKPPSPAPKSRPAAAKMRPSRKRAARPAAAEPRLAEAPLPTFRSRLTWAGLGDPAAAALFGRLASKGVDSAEAAALVAGAQESAGADPDALERTVRAALVRGCRTHAPEAGATIAFAGPAGAGKTSCALKLAAAGGAGLILFGRHPVGAFEALDVYATLLGAPYETAETVAELTEAAQRLRERIGSGARILIDTPALADSAKSEARALAAALAAISGAETHLTLAATSSGEDMARAIERYAPLSPRALAFTRLDEAALPGSLWNECRRSGLPVSFAAEGPNVADGLAPAGAQRLTDRLLAA